MNISKIHKRYSERLNNPEVLTNPEEFLGPNYEAVLNYWLILDGLSQDQLKAIEGRYRHFYDNHYSEWNRATNEAYDAFEETIGDKFADYADNASYVVYGIVSLSATRELIGMHKILEQEKPLIFFNMFLDQFS